MTDEEIMFIRLFAPIKAKIQDKNRYITELEKENAELKKQNKEILEDNDTLNKWIDELKAQIEKMKCCGNCRHWKNESIQKYCVLTAPDFLIKKRIDKCDKWESAKS